MPKSAIKWLASTKCSRTNSMHQLCLLRMEGRKSEKWIGSRSGERREGRKEGKKLVIVFVQWSRRRRGGSNRTARLAGCGDRKQTSSFFLSSFLSFFAATKVDIDGAGADGRTDGAMTNLRNLCLLLLLISSVFRRLSSQSAQFFFKVPRLPSTRRGPPQTPVEVATPLQRSPNMSRMRTRLASEASWHDQKIPAPAFEREES